MIRTQIALDEQTWPGRLRVIPVGRSVTRVHEDGECSSAG